MNKYVLVSAGILSILLFIVNAQPHAVASSTAMTASEIQDMARNSIDEPFPSINSQIGRKIISPTYLQIPIIRVQNRPTAYSSATAQPSITPHASSVSTTSPSPLPTLDSTNLSTAAPSVTNRSEVDEVIALVNSERSKAGLASLQKNNSLTNSAQHYAQFMADKNFFSHTGIDGSTFITRNTAAGYTGYKWMGENIAAGQQSPQQAVRDWMNSSGHKANILSTKAKEIGVGYAVNNGSTYKRYWVQEFGAR